MINKITIKNSVKIYNDEYVRKKKKNNEIDKIYEYLLSRSFDYFPEIVKEDDEYIYYKYINDETCKVTSMFPKENQLISSPMLQFQTIFR